LSNFSKILEKIVYVRAINFLNLHLVLTPTQYGFRSNYFISQAILDMVTKCYDNINEKMFTGLVLLDLAKVFDTVDHEILLYKSNHYDIRESVNMFSQSNLKNRKQYISVKNCNSKLKIKNIGVPQGSTLGLLLFLIYINDLSKSVDFTPRLYADDTCLVVTAL